MDLNSLSDSSPIPGFLRRLYDCALSAAAPAKVVPPYLPLPPKGRTVVVGVGKAACAMAQAVEAHWKGALDGVVVVPVGAALPTTRIRVHESSHPIPDERSLEGAELLMQAVSGLQPDDLVIALVSGGGSALSCLPAPGLSLEEKQHITQALLACGATISEINTVRKHLSAFKGGRLAAQAFPARVVTLVISDIPGDDPAMVASGPTMADVSTCADALAVLARHGLTISARARQSLESGLWESIKPDDARLQGHTHHLISCAWDGLAAAARQAQQEGVLHHILSESMEGEARDLAKAHAAICTSIANRAVPFDVPCVLLSGGEATVTLRGNGRGGRNTEFVLAMALALERTPPKQPVFILSAGTDGLDGRAGAAGAWCGPHTLSAARAMGMNPQAYLDANDSATLLDRVGCLIQTGPTHTNINDFRAVWVGSVPAFPAN